MATTARRPATATRVHIQAILEALRAAGSPGAITPRVLDPAGRRAFRRRRPVYVSGPAAYPLGPLAWFWETCAKRSRRPAGLTVDGGLLVCLPDATSQQMPDRWRPVHSDLTATTAADLDAVAERLELLAAAHGIVVADPDPATSAWTGDGTA